MTDLTPHTQDAPLACMTLFGAARGVEIIELVESSTGHPCPCRRGKPCPLLPREA
jgi:hypothetical protein